jgi:protein-tyrosine phosphatase
VTHILVVCTANLARSPLLAAMLRSAAQDRLGPDTIEVGSAGTEARFGEAAALGAQRLAEERGLTLDGHRSRPLTYVRATDPELVLTMTRAHARAVARWRPALASRTFLLRELVAVVSSAETSDSAREAEDDATGLARFHASVRDAHGTRPRRSPRRYDVPDPVNGRERAFQRMAQEFDRATPILADALFGPVQ